MTTDAQVLDYGDFMLTVPSGWDDITDTLEDDDIPVTIADTESGVGALQLSVGIHEGGKKPQLAVADLAEILSDLAKEQGFKKPFDVAHSAGEHQIAAASYRSEGDVIRYWLVSDGKSVVMLTYVCEVADQGVEAEQCEAIVRSLRFKPPKAKKKKTVNKKKRSKKAKSRKRSR